MSLEGNNWGDRFSDMSAKALTAFMSTYNMVSQAVAFAGIDPATTGTGDCTINGVYIQSLTVEDDADWDSTTSTDLVQGDALGTFIPDGYSVYIAIFANSLGRLRIDLASEIALDADVELKIPWFDPTTWCCIGLSLIDGDGSDTLGTHSIVSVDTVYQVIGPVLPHPDNLKI